MLYAGLRYDFHLQAISEMLRVCKEVRIIPLLNLNSEISELTERVIAYFKKHYFFEIKKMIMNFKKMESRY